MAVDVLVLGAGYVGRAAARLAREQGRRVLTTARSPERAAALRAEGFEVQQAAQLGSSVAQYVGENTQVLVCFPPDPATDRQVAPALHAAGAITYVSSTGVYGSLVGVVDDATTLPAPDARAARILAGEDCYRQQGATVLRCPGIYGPDRGLHLRVVRGEHRIPGDGSHMLSRVHVEDLAQLLLAARSTRAECFVVGDRHPARHLEVVEYICEAYGVPLPPCAPLDTVHASLRANRSVDSSRALATLGINLRYPSYRDGMAPGATGLLAPRPLHRDG